MYVFVNAAISADGKISTRNRAQVSLSGPTDRARVHLLRDRADAILVGSGTVEADNPRLTARGDVLESDADLANPARVVIDTEGTVSTDARVFTEDAPTFVIVSELATTQRRRELRNAGATVIVAGRTRVDLGNAVHKLEDYGADSLMIEGGGEIIASAFQNGLVDGLYTYVAPRILGGCQAPTLVDDTGFVDECPELKRVDVTPIDGGVLIHWKVTNSP